MDNEHTPIGQSGAKLGAGDAAYILAWCAWSQAEIQAYEDWNADEARQRFIRWWNDSGMLQLSDYGYQVLDTEAGRADAQAPRSASVGADSEHTGWGLFDSSASSGRQDSVEANHPSKPTTR